jgi:hypothetical protein
MLGSEGKTSMIIVNSSLFEEEAGICGPVVVREVVVVVVVVVELVEVVAVDDKFTETGHELVDVADRLLEGVSGSLGS